VVPLAVLGDLGGARHPKLAAAVVAHGDADML
jgi:hypothetical protein